MIALVLVSGDGTAKKGDRGSDKKARLGNAKRCIVVSYTQESVVLEDVDIGVRTHI